MANILEILCLGLSGKTLAWWAWALLPSLKAIQLLMVFVKYSESRLQPFARMAYQFSVISCMANIVYFAMCYDQADFNADLGASIQDLSLICDITGVVVTLTLDFIWAVSSSDESSVLFHREMSASDFVMNWYFIQVFVIAGLMSIRYIPMPLPNEVVLRAATTFILVASLGFSWVCLAKAKGSSNATPFKAAYRAALTVNVVCTVIAVHSALMLSVLWSYFPLFQRAYVMQAHLCESFVVFIIICYFIFVKEQPSEIHNHLHDLRNKRVILKHKSALQSLVGIQCSQSIERPLLSDSL